MLTECKSVLENLLPLDGDCEATRVAELWPNALCVFRAFCGYQRVLRVPCVTEGESLGVVRYSRLPDEDAPPPPTPQGDGEAVKGRVTLPDAELALPEAVRERAVQVRGKPNHTDAEETQ